MTFNHDVSKVQIKLSVSALLFTAFILVSPAHAAMNRRQPIQWGGLSAARSRATVTQYRQWRPLWRYIWSRTEKAYDMSPARSVAGSPACSARLGMGRIVEQTIDAVSRRRSGDVVNRLGLFQSQLLCLSVDGAHGMDFALAAFNFFAMRDLRGRERQQAVAGSFNLGLLAFDAIQYSDRSWWLPVMAQDLGTVAGVIRRYPGEDLGLWLYNVEDGRLQQVKFGGRDWHVYTGLMHAFAHPDVFDHGECGLLGMADKGFSCGRGAADNRSMGSGTGSGGGGGGFGMGGSGGGTSCMISAAMRTGSLGSLSCLARAGGLGGLHMPTTAASHIQVQGVVDSQCAVGDGPNKPPKLPKYNPKKAGDEHAKAKGGSHEHADSLGARILGILHIHLGGGGGSKPAKSSSHSHPPPMPQPGEQGYAQKMAAVKAYYDKEKAELKKHGLKKFKSGGHAVNGSAGGGGCGGHGTNAAAQVAAMFACTGTGMARGGTSASGPRFPGAGGGGGPFSMPVSGGAAGGGGGSPSGLLSCAMQGGQLVRTSRNDKRCQQSYCAQGQRCSCNGGGGSAPSSVTAAGRRKITGANNQNVGATDYGRNHVGNFGGFTGPKLPAFGGGPSKK